MDIKQMKNFVSQELKGLKQEHRLLSVRRFWGGVARGCYRGDLPWGEVCVPPGNNDLVLFKIERRTSAFCLKKFLFQGACMAPLG